MIVYYPSGSNEITNVFISETDGASEKKNMRKIEVRGMQLLALKMEGKPEPRMWEASRS